MSERKHHSAQGSRSPDPRPEGAAAEATVSLSAARVRAVSESTAVSTIMTAEVTALAPEASVGAATELFLERDVSAAPVVDAGWLPLAMVSKTDLLRHWVDRTPRSDALGRQRRRAGASAADASSPAAVTDEEAGTHAPAKVRLGAGGEGTETPQGSPTQVADVTAPYVLSLHEDAPISVAAALMAYENVHRLPIVSSAGEVVGIVSTLDIVRWLAESTGMGASE